MWTQSYLELLKNLLELDLKFLCPWKDGTENSKLSKLFRACYVSPLILGSIMSSFVYFEWNNLSFTVIAENSALVITFARSFGYALLVKKFYFEYEKQVARMLDDRKTLPSGSKEKLLTESCCKIELLLTVAYHLNCFCMIVPFLHGFVYFLPNVYQLPYNCFIFCLPPDSFMFAWELNYLIQTVTVTLVALSAALYLPPLFLLMNHSCWLVDLALMTADDLNEHLQLDEDICGPKRVATTDESLKKLIERCEKFVEWQNEVQDLLSWWFNLEFQIQALILCLAIYVLSFTFAAGVVLLLFIFCSVQLFVLCWMGTRVTSCIDQLSIEISQNWHLMTPKQRKPLQMIVHWTQNMHGFRGTFKDVNLETCKAIFEASHAFYAFLRSTKDN